MLIFIQFDFSSTVVFDLLKVLGRAKILLKSNIFFGKSEILLKSNIFFGKSEILLKSKFLLKSQLLKSKNYCTISVPNIHNFFVQIFFSFCE
jgi:hypothetical protein